MSDPVNQWLISQLQGRDRKDTEKALWVADENALDNLPTLKAHARHLKIISNRYDIAQPLIDAGLDCRFCDFDFSAIADNSLKRIYYRVSKEKPAVHHIINHACRTLTPGGELVMAGLKNEGTKTYLDKAAKLFNATGNLSKQQSVHTGIIQKGPATDCNDRLDSKNYPALRPVAEVGELHIESKPGVFGWNKVDQGSAFLIEHLEKFVDSLAQPPKNLLDLGCGYGYLTLMSYRLPLKKRVATDNNAAAIIAAERNFSANQLRVEVVATDCADGITEQFDMVLCNPPFHQGFSVDSRLTEKFLLNTRNRLSKKGAALFVVNQFIPLETKAKQHFNKVDTFARNRSFKLVRLSQQ